MSSNLQNALVLLVYAVIATAAIVGAKYGLIDTGLSDGIVGALLGHMGMKFSPTPKGGTSTP